MQNENIDTTYELIKKGIDALYSKPIEAIGFFDEVIKLEPENSFAWTMKGEALLELGKYNEALKCLDRAIELDPKSANAWYKRGLVFLSTNNKEALRCFDKVIEFDLENDNAWGHKWLILQELGKHEEALKCLDKSIELREKRLKKEEALNEWDPWL